LACAAYLQTIRRIRRLGQTKETSVTTYVKQGTDEERVYGLQVQFDRGDAAPDDDDDDDVSTASR
jgi:hypothetical protein